MTSPILIFGATGGIGRALSRKLAALDTPVFLSAKSHKPLASLATEIDAPYAVCDVLETSSITDTVQQAAANGSIGGLAYCVGSIVLKPLRSVTEADFDNAFHLNVVGAAMAIKAAHKALLEAGGSVVLFSTIAVAQGFTNHSVISAAKGGIEGLTRSAAAELAPKVRVNAVAPSLTRTPLSGEITKNDAMAKAIAQLHAIPRLGEPDDIASAAAFLLGPESSWMTGQVVHVDGGRGRVRTKG